MQLSGMPMFHVFPRNRPGRESDVRLEQPSNALPPMLVTGYPAISVGITNAPDGDSVVPVIVIASFDKVLVKTSFVQTA